MSTISINDLDNAFDDKGWDPQYYEIGEKFHTVSAYHIVVNERNLYVEVISHSWGELINELRVCEFDEEEKNLIDAWTVSEWETAEDICNEIEEYANDN